MSATVRRIHTGEGATLREIRLRALADAPQAFASPLSAEEGFSPERWNEMAARGASGHHVATFFASEGEAMIGLVTGLRKEESAEKVDLVSMWVAPEARKKQGVAKRLVDAVLSWAQECGVQRVELWVLEGNDAAERFYRRAGFTAAPHSTQLPYGSGEGLRMWHSVKGGNTDA